MDKTKICLIVSGSAEDIEQTGEFVILHMLVPNILQIINNS